jgi:arylsulfatase A-like enzyme
MPRKSVLVAVLALAGIAAVIVAAVIVPRMGRAAGPGRYNVLLITLDTTRADHLGCYGYTRKTSPNLDALAADSVRFDLAIATSAVTPMSHASILTGLNPDRHGVRVFYGPTGHFLTQAHPTLATILKSHGWQTGAFVSAYPASERFGLHWGFDTFASEVAPAVMTQDQALPLPKDGYWVAERTASAQRRADATIDQTVQWLKTCRRPFCLWVHLFDPHDVSLVPPKEIMDRFGASPHARDPYKAAYDPEIFFMDMQIGRLLEYLKSCGEYDKTVIVAVADHGQGLGDHNWFPHRLLYQEQIWLPLLVRLPQGPRGRVVPSLVRSIDIVPTVLEVLGFEPPDSVQGLSLCGLINGQAEDPRIGYAEALNTLDLHTPDPLPPQHRDLLFCIVEPPWKLIYHYNTPENSELYNLASDPQELHNVAAQFRDEVTRLAATLDESGAMAVQIIEPNSPLDQEAIDKLRSLGYLGK